MKLKKQNGFTIEMMIVFMLVTFGLCMLIITFLSSLILDKKLASQQIDRQLTLNQIGEYYLRAVEAGQTFPTLKESENLNNITWVKNDAAAKEFFTDCKGEYLLKSEYAVKRGGFLEFYAEKAASYKLTVTSDSKVQMVVIVVETKQGSNQANYEIKDWSITDIHEGIGDYAESEDLGVLKKIWIWLGNTINRWEDYIGGLFS